MDCALAARVRCAAIVVRPVQQQSQHSMARHRTGSAQAPLAGIERCAMYLPADHVPADAQLLNTCVTQPCAHLNQPGG